MLIGKRERAYLVVSTEYICDGRCTYRVHMHAHVQLGTGEAWAVICNVLVWGLPVSFTTLDIRSIFVDIGLASFVTGIVYYTTQYFYSVQC